MANVTSNSATPNIDEPIKSIETAVKELRTHILRVEHATSGAYNHFKEVFASSDPDYQQRGSFLTVMLTEARNAIEEIPSKSVSEDAVLNNVKRRLSAVDLILHDRLAEAEALEQEMTTESSDSDEVRDVMQC